MVAQKGVQLSRGWSNGREVKSFRRIQTKYILQVPKIDTNHPYYPFYTDVTEELVVK